MILPHMAYHSYWAAVVVLVIAGIFAVSSEKKKLSFEGIYPTWSRLKPTEFVHNIESGPEVCEADVLIHLQNILFLII